MNESELRRKKLLEETRNRYSDKKLPPAIHPRYGFAYKKIYGEEQESSDKSTFALRGFVAVLLFAAFLAMDYQQTKVLKVDAARIMKEIEYQIDVPNTLSQYIK